MISVLVTASLASLFIRRPLVILSCCSITFRLLLICFSSKRLLTVRLKTRLRMFLSVLLVSRELLSSRSESCLISSTAVWLLWRYRSWFQISIFFSISLPIVSVCRRTSESFRHSVRNLSTLLLIVEIIE